MNNNTNENNGPDISRNNGASDRAGDSMYAGQEGNNAGSGYSRRMSDPEYGNSRGTGYSRRVYGSDTERRQGSEYSRRVSGSRQGSDYGSEYSRRVSGSRQGSDYGTGYSRRMSESRGNGGSSYESGEPDPEYDGSSYPSHSGSGHHSHSGSGHHSYSGSGHHSYSGSGHHSHSGSGHHSYSGSGHHNRSGDSFGGGSGYDTGSQDTGKYNESVYNSDGSHHSHHSHRSGAGAGDRENIGTAAADGTGSRSGSVIKMDTRTAVSILFAFLLSILFVCGSTLCVIQSSVSRKMTERQTLDRDYISLVKQEIYDNAIDYTLPTGIDVVVLDSVFREEDIEKDISAEISRAFEDGEEYKPTANALRKRLRANLEAYFETIDVSSERENNALIIQEYIEDIVEIYASGIKVVGLKYIVNAGGKFRKYAVIALIGIALLSVYLIVLLIKMHHYIHHALSFISYSAGAAALMLFTVPFIVWASKGYKRIGVTPQSLYYLVVSLVGSVLKQFFTASLLWLIAAVALIILINYMTGKNDSKRRVKRYIKKKTVQISDAVFDKYYKIKRLFKR